MPNVTFKPIALSVVLLNDSNLSVLMLSVMAQHSDNTYKDFTYNDFTYNIWKLQHKGLYL
jgi:hypothetical protein